MSLLIFFASLLRRWRSFFFFCVDRIYATHVLFIFIWIIRTLIFSMLRLFADKAVKLFIFDLVLWFLERFRIVAKVIKFIVNTRWFCVCVSIEFIFWFTFVRFVIFIEIFVIFKLMISVNNVCFILITLHYFLLHYD